MQDINYKRVYISDTYIYDVAVPVATYCALIDIPRNDRVLLRRTCVYCDSCQTLLKHVSELLKLSISCTAD